MNQVQKEDININKELQGDQIWFKKQVVDHNTNYKETRRKNNLKLQ